MSKNISLSLDVSQDLYNMLDDMAETSHSSKGDILKKAVILLNIIFQEKKQGVGVGFIKNNEIVKEIVNL